MVAISLYRGNLHRVPDVPRRWLMPNHNISIKDFKSLLHRRSKALSRLPSSPSHSPSKITQIPNPNLNSTIKLDGERPKSNGSVPEGPMAIERVGDGDGHGDGSDSKPYFSLESSQLVQNGGVHLNDENLAVSTNPNAEKGRVLKLVALSFKLEEGDLLDGKEKRKKEVEEKLKVLNEKKHNLVQVLKQILHVEEELKTRSSVQGMASRPSAPLQVEATADTGSMTRQLASRIGSEANVSGDIEGGEADDLLNHNVHYRQMLRTSSMSPSSESPLRRPAHIQSNVVSHPSRANFGVMGSPSCFPPTGQQGLPNLPTISVSGTNYIASSPSPAASGGTSVFRDARQPSPWN